MWYVIQARFAYDDEDDLYVREANTEHEATAALEAELRESCDRPLCDACKAGIEAGESSSTMTEACDECDTFYVINTIECDTEPGATHTHLAAENAAEIALSLNPEAVAAYIDGPEIGESKHMLIVRAVTEAALVLTQVEEKEKTIWGEGADWYLTCDAIAARIIDNPHTRWTADELSTLVVRD